MDNSKPSPSQKKKHGRLITNYKFYKNEQSRLYGEIHSFGSRATGKIEVPLSASHNEILNKLADTYGMNRSFGFRAAVLRSALVREFLRLHPEHLLAEQLKRQIADAGKTTTPE